MTKIYLKNKTQSEINFANELLKKYVSEEDYFFYSNKNVKEEYEWFKSNPQDYPSHLYPLEKIKSLKDFKEYWNPKNDGFVPEIGVLSFDCYFGRTPDEVMAGIGKFLVINHGMIKKVKGSFSTFVERAELNDEDQTFLLNLFN